MPVFHPKGLWSNSCTVKSISVHAKLSFFLFVMQIHCPHDMPKWINKLRKKKLAQWNKNQQTNGKLKLLQCRPSWVWAYNLDVQTVLVLNAKLTSLGHAVKQLAVFLRTVYWTYGESEHWWNSPGFNGDVSNQWWPKRGFLIPGLNCRYDLDPRFCANPCLILST